jgi:hypothetical protein
LLVAEPFREIRESQRKREGNKMTYSGIDRVLGRRGARTLTPAEIEVISGGARLTNTQRLTMVNHLADMLPDFD